MAIATITINFDYDNILDIADEIGSLPTYKRFPDDDMFLIDREDIIKILQRHVVRKEVQK